MENNSDKLTPEQLREKELERRKARLRRRAMQNGLGLTINYKGRQSNRHVLFELISRQIVCDTGKGGGLYSIEQYLDVCNLVSDLRYRGVRFRVKNEGLS